MAWLEDWDYRKKITIGGQSGAGTDFQVLLKVGESAGASGDDFHVEGHSANFPDGKNDGGDLRFTKDDEVTLEDSWVERVEGSSPNRVAYIWVKVSDNLDSDQDIYIYYGNSGASNGSSGEDTFIFFDDFDYANESELLAAGWGKYSIPTIGLSNSVLTVTNSVSPAHIYKNVGGSDILNNIVEMYWWRASAHQMQAAHIGYEDSDGGTLLDTNNFLCIRYDTSGSGNHQFGGGIGSVSDSPEDTWQICQVFHQGGTSYAYEARGTLRAQRTWSPPSGNMDYVLLGRNTRSGGYTGESKYDWILIRKYCSPEPAFGSEGEEEEAPPPAKPIYIRGGVDAVNYQKEFLQGVMGPFEKTMLPFLPGNISSLYAMAGFLTGDADLIGERLAYLIGSVEHLWSRKLFLSGNADALWEGMPYLQGTVTVVPFHIKATVGSWFLRLSSVMKEVS